MDNDHERVVPTNRDITLTCKDCTSNFTFSKGEQQYYHDRFLSEPLRCPKCRAIRKSTVHPPMSVVEEAIERANAQFPNDYHQGGCDG